MDANRHAEEAFYSISAKGTSLLRLPNIIFSVLMLLHMSQSFAAEKITYYHYDLLGSPIAATNEKGEVLWREEYSPYGNKLLNQDAMSDNVRGYTGHVHDTETGLTYMQARYFDPEIGRFMGVDPVEFHEDNPAYFNRYAYAGNNPYKYIDKTGEAYGDPEAPEPEGSAFNHADWNGISSGAGTFEDWKDSVTPSERNSWMIRSLIRERGSFGVLMGLGIKVFEFRAVRFTKSAGKLNPQLIQENPRSLIPTQIKSEMSGSQVKRLAKDMKQNGFDQSKPVDAWRNPNTGRLEIQDGHHRTEAAKKAGLEKIPVRV